MRNGLLLFWWFLTLFLMASTLLGPRLGGTAPDGGPAPVVAILAYVSSIGFFVWILLGAGLLLTRRKRPPTDPA